jgi:serine/threonine-protein kinase
VSTPRFTRGAARRYARTVVTGAGASAARAYRPVRALARGGMGEVAVVVRSEGRYRRIYALKRLLPHWADDAQVRAMFLDEARIAGLVRHANVTSVLDVGEDESGPFLVMDYVDGPSVARLAAAAAAAREPLPIPAALEIVRQAALGLHAAHELTGATGVPLDVVHRDVSPQNLLVGLDGTVRVTDFGVVRALDRATQTDEGSLKGKSGYVSPEQLRFAPLDRRSDLFALGVVLWELLAGERLYAGDRPVVFRRILDEAPPAIGAIRSGVGGAVEHLVGRMLAKDRTERPATAREVADALDVAIRELSPSSIDLGAIVERYLPSEREAQRALVAEALSSDTSSGPSSGASSGIVARARPAPGASTPRRAAAPRAATALATIVLVGGALALAYAVVARMGGAREADVPLSPSAVMPPSVAAAPAAPPEPRAEPVAEPAALPADPAPERRRPGRARASAAPLAPAEERARAPSPAAAPRDEPRPEPSEPAHAEPSPGRGVPVMGWGE